MFIKPGPCNYNYELFNPFGLVCRKPNDVYFNIGLYKVYQYNLVLISHGLTCNLVLWVRLCASCVHVFFYIPITVRWGYIPYKAYIFLISVKLWDNLAISVRLYSVCCWHSTGRKNDDIDFKFSKNIGSFCTQVGVENRANRSERKRAVERKLKATPIF